MLIHVYGNLRVQPYQSVSRRMRYDAKYIDKMRMNSVPLEDADYFNGTESVSNQKRQWILISQSDSQKQLRTLYVMKVYQYPKVK